MDLASAYETPTALIDNLQLILQTFGGQFDIDDLIRKANAHADVRVEVLIALDFQRLLHQHVTPYPDDFIGKCL